MALAMTIARETASFASWAAVRTLLRESLKASSAMVSAERYACIVLAEVPGAIAFWWICDIRSS